MCSKHYRRYTVGYTGDEFIHGKVRTNERNCTVKDCTARAKSKGMCARHYQQHIKIRNLITGYTPKPRRYITPDEVCSEHQCQTKVRARGMCRAHYERYLRKKHKDVTEGVTQ